MFAAYPYDTVLPHPFAGLSDGTLPASSAPSAPTGAVPGVFCIDAGDAWSNFVRAAAVPVDYFIKNVVLKKELPQLGQCADVYTAQPNYPGFTQQGSIKIRRWWPLMFEAPGTTWTLKVAYGTKRAVQLPGETSAGYIHTDEWKWYVDADIESMKNALTLFGQLPWGLCEVPLINDSALYRDLTDLLDEVRASADAGDTVTAGNKLIEFEIMVGDACSATCPDYASATVPAIVSTLEYPVCCKLIADAEYVGKKMGILVPAK